MKRRIRAYGEIEVWEYTLTHSVNPFFIVLWSGSLVEYFQTLEEAVNLAHGLHESLEDIRAGRTTPIETLWDNLEDDD